MVLSYLKVLLVHICLVTLISYVNKNELIQSIACRLTGSDFNVKQFVQVLSIVDGKVCDGKKAIINQLLNYLSFLSAKK